MKKILPLWLSLALLFSYANAQPGMQYSSTSSKAIKSFEKAKELLNERKDAEAVKALEKAMEADPGFVEPRILLSELSAEKGDLESAIKMANEVAKINPDFFKGNYLNLAEWNYLAAHYAEVIPPLERYLSLPGISADGKKAANRLLAAARFSAWAMEHPVPYEPKNLGKNVNSPLDEYLPSLTADEQELVITVLAPRDPSRGNDPRNMFEDFYGTKKDKGQWQPRRNLGPPVNTEGNEGAQFVSADGQYLFFTACEEYGSYPGGRKGFGSCDIFFARRINGKYGVPKNIGAPISSGAWDSQPCLSADGTTLYFTSSRAGGKGGADIWRSKMGNDGRWSAPENLGDSVNTAGNEEGPFLHPDGKTLYFSSTGHPGLGAADLFFCRIREDGKFGKAINLGYPINTKGDERDIIVNTAGNTAFVSSKREGGEGGMDIYSFDLYPAARPQAVTYVKGTVLNAESGEPLSSLIELTNLLSGKNAALVESDPAAGQFLVCLPKGTDYALSISKPGFLFHSENFSLLESASQEPFQLTVKLMPLKAGNKVVLKNVFFNTGSYALEQRSASELDKLVKLLQGSPELKIEIGGHTDNVGDKQKNMTLSENRAKSVFDYLVNAGIEASRLSFKGYGDSQPVADNNKEEGRAMNRRTEFKVIL
jgi:outer membrane protein OmpA-like peptidoglycan-associated protein